MRRSIARECNKKFGDLSVWAKRRSNSQLFKQMLTEMTDKYHVGNRGRMVIVLVGSTDHFSVVTRWAQSILRWDRKPSLWSHAFLIAEPWDERANINDVPILEVPLFPRSGRFYDRSSNGLVRTSTLGHYKDATIDANIAILTVVRRVAGVEGGSATLEPLSDDDLNRLTSRALEPNFDRLRYAFWEWTCAWQTYLWSEGEARNPFRDGIPHPASAYIEMVYEALGCDLVPGASERNGAPEHLWNAAQWWHQDTAELAAQDVNPFVLSGAFAIRDAGATIDLGK